jgi:hypothetical protein
MQAKAPGAVRRPRAELARATMERDILEKPRRTLHSARYEARLYSTPQVSLAYINYEL